MIKEAVLKPLTRLMLTAEIHKQFTYYVNKTFIFMLKIVNDLATHCFYIDNCEKWLCMDFQNFVASSDLMHDKNSNFMILSIIYFLDLIKQFNGKNFGMKCVALYVTV
jgi:hypothetical protein